MRAIESGRLVLPRDARGARRFAEESLLTVHGKANRLLAAMRPPRIRGRALESPLPVAKLATDGLAIDGAVESTLERWLAKAEEWVFVRDYPASFRAKRLVFLFAPGGAAPFALVKLRGCGGTEPSLERERLAIESIRERLPASLVSTLPSVLDSLESGGSEILVLSILPGRPLGISMQRSLRPHVSFAAHLAAAGEWLGHFHRTTAEGTFSGRVDDRASIHGDLWPRNVLTDPSGATTGVVDWESGEESGPFWRDVFTLPMLFGAEGEGDPVLGAERTIAATGALGAAIRGWFDAYCRTSGVPRRSLRMLFEAFANDSMAIGGKEGGWRAKLDWKALLSRASGSASVFSG